MNLSRILMVLICGVAASAASDAFAESGKSFGSASLEINAFIKSQVHKS